MAVRVFFISTILFLALLLLSCVVTITATDPNYRAFSESNGFEYGYINLKAYPGMKLNMTPFDTTITATRNDCAFNCFMTKERQCQSVNMKEIESKKEYECQLLELDKHKAYPHFIAATEEYVYYDIHTQCSEVMPCPNENYWCIPHHKNGTYSCICKHGFHGDKCKERRQTTFSLKVTKASSDSIRAPNVARPIPPSAPKEAAVSFWFYYDGINLKNNGLFNLRFPPLNCFAPRIKSESDGGKVSGTNKNLGRQLTSESWVNVVINTSVKDVTIYIDGKFVMKVPISFDATAVSEVEVLLGNGFLKKEDGSCKYVGASYTFQASFKEVYVWNRLLDVNDIPLIHQKKFLPYNPIITWDDFKNDLKRPEWSAEMDENIGV